MDDLLEGAGHAPMLEAPDAFVRVLVGFLDSLRRVDEATDLPPAGT